MLARPALRRKYSTTIAFYFGARLA